MYREHFHVPDSMPSTYIWGGSPTTLRGRFLLSSHFIDEGTEAQRCLLIYPRAQSQQMAESGCGARPSRFQNPYSETWFWNHLEITGPEKKSLKAVGHKAWIFQPIHHFHASHLSKWHCNPLICPNNLGVTHDVCNHFSTQNQLLPWLVSFTS